MSWLQQNANLISALASTGMMGIWVLYAWLFYQEFRRQRGSDLFIHEAGGSEPNSVCVLVNLSREPVHVLCSLAARDGATVRLGSLTGGDEVSAARQARQGPLASGDSMPLGTFEEICNALNVVCDAGSSDDAQLVEVRVAAIHGFREWPVGARRRFRIGASMAHVRPETVNTEQLRSRHQAHEVQQWITASQEPESRGPRDRALDPE